MSPRPARPYHMGLLILLKVLHGNLPLSISDTWEVFCASGRCRTFTPWNRAAALGNETLVVLEPPYVCHLYPEH